MNKHVHRPRTGEILLALAACVLMAGPIARAEGKAELTVAEAPPPDAFAGPIREAMAGKVYRLADDEGVFFEFWFRREVPLTQEPSGSQVNAAAPQTLIGVLKVHRERYDFRDEEIPPGHYTLRLAMQPVDGDHLGSAPTRTFLLLAHTADDPSPDALSDEFDLFEAASLINAAGHPSNLNIQPVDDEPEEVPSLGEHNGGEHKVLYVRLPARVEGADEATRITFAIVYEGYGHI